MEAILMLVGELICSNNDSKLSRLHIFFGLDFGFIFIFGVKIMQFERLLLCVPEVDLSHGPRIESVQEVVVRSF